MSANSVSHLLASPGYAMHAVEHTIANPVHFEDKGLFTGDPVTMVVRPAAAGTGIVLVRTDLPDTPEVPAHWGRVADAENRNMMLGVSANASIWTVEHLLSALAGLGIDNARVELDGREVPIFDGSAAYLVERLEMAGLVSQERLRSWIRVQHPVEVSEGASQVRIEPAEAFVVSGTIDYPETAIGRQSYDFTLDGTSFRDELAPARTFCTAADAARLRIQGLGKGGSLDNVIVVDGMKVHAQGGLRFPDEFIRHKVLDCVGDLYLAGAPLLGRVNFVRGGHRMNRRLLTAIFESPRNWERSTRPPKSGAWAQVTEQVAVA